MQKINIASIVTWHLRTFRDDEGHIIWSDIGTFYVVPLLLCVAFYVLDWRVPKDAVEVSVSVFSIFAALLLSVQVALYSVSLRPLTPPADVKKMKSYEGIVAVRASVIRELNDNISYLILLSVIWVSILLGLFVLDCQGRLASACIFGMYAHFFLTLLMVVKRAAIIFSREYET